MEKKSKYQAILLTIVTALCVYRYIDSQTLLLVNTSKEAPSGYLPIKDYAFIDSGTGDVVEKINSFSYDGTSISYDYNTDIETTKGITATSTWDEFVEAYGEYKADYITYNKPYSDGVESDYGYLYWTTVNEFDENYVKTGKVDLENYDITICFKALVKYSKVYYTATEQDKIDTYGFKLYKAHEFNFTFSYECPNNPYNTSNTGIFDYISSYCYTY